MAGTTTVQRAIQNPTVTLPGAALGQARCVVAWRRQPGGTWWPRTDIWTTNAERDDAALARRTRPISRSDST